MRSLPTYFGSLSPPCSFPLVSLIFFPISSFSPRHGFRGQRRKRAEPNGTGKPIGLVPLRCCRKWPDFCNWGNSLRNSPSGMLWGEVPKTNQGARALTQSTGFWAHLAAKSCHFLSWERLRGARAPQVKTAVAGDIPLCYWSKASFVAVSLTGALAAMSLDLQTRSTGCSTSKVGVPHCNPLRDRKNALNFQL